MPSILLFVPVSVFLSMKLPSVSLVSANLGQSMDACYPLNQTSGSFPWKTRHWLTRWGSTVEANSICHNLVPTCGNAADHKGNAVHSQDWLTFALFWRGVTTSTLRSYSSLWRNCVSSEHSFSAKCRMSSLWPLPYQSLWLGFQAQFWCPECGMCSAGIGCPCASIRLHPIHQQAKWSSKHFLTVSGNHVLPHSVSQEKYRT